MSFVELLKVDSFWPNMQTTDTSVEVHGKLKEFHGHNLKWNASLNHGSIEKLFLERCIITNINMPNLRSAKFYNISFPPDMQLNDNIQELSLDYCKNAENLLAFVEHPNVNLKLLELTNMQLSSRRMIDANTHKIQKLIIDRVTLVP